MISVEHIGLTAAAISAAAMIVAVSRLGMDFSLTRFFPQSRDKGGFYNALILIILLVTIIVLAGFFMGLPYLSPALLFLNQWQFSLLFTGYVFLTAVCDMQGTAFVAIRRADLALLQYGLLFLRIPLLIILGPLGISGIFLALDITYLVMLVVGIILLYNMNVARDLHLDIGETRNTIVYSLGNYISTIVSTAPITLIPVMIVNLTGAIDVAYFYIDFTVATFLFMVPDSIATSMFVEGSHEQPLRGTTMKALRFSFGILAPMMLAIIVLGDNVLLLFSPVYSAAAHQLLLLLAISSLFYAANAIYITVMQVQKNIAMVNYIRIGVSGSTICLSFALLLKFGLIGVGYAWLLSNVIISVIVGWMILSKKKW